MKSLFEVYAFCEGMWRTPAWVMAVDLTAHPIDPETLRASIVKAVKKMQKSPWKAHASNVVLEPAPTTPVLASEVVEIPRKYRRVRRQISGPSHNDVGTFPGDFVDEWVPED